MIPSQDQPAYPKAAAEVSAPWLNYAQPRRFARLRRWLRPGSPAFLLLVLALAAGGTWETWKLRLKMDERAFNARASVGPGAGWITFSKPPNPASLRHLGRMPGTWTLYFDWPGPEDSAAPLVLRGRRCAGVTALCLGHGVEADVWLKELASPDSGLKALATLGFGGTKVTDTGLKALASPECGLLALTTLDLAFTSVTDAGLKELARPDSGLKVLTSLNLLGTPVTGEGIAALKKARPGLQVHR